MKLVRIAPDDNKCVGCHICELTCSNVNFNVNNPRKSAIRITKISELEGFHIAVCNQCGKCARECPEEAIALVNGAYRVVEDRCTLCGVCVEICPIDAMWWRPGVRMPVKCIGCEACIDVCPTQALSVKHVELKPTTT